MSPRLTPQSFNERDLILRRHRDLVLAIRRLEKEIAPLAAAADPRWRALESERSEKVRGIEPLIEAYWDWVPSVTLGRCPFCGADFNCPFDPVDLSGFWWMDRTQRPFRRPPKRCDHFRLLLGAVHLNGLPVKDMLFECCPGPEVPYVIPRILEMPTMQAVVSALDMECGYTAHPVLYFSSRTQAERALTQPWARRVYSFVFSDGRRGWDIVEDDYDFDLRPWVASGKLRWMENGKLSPAGADPGTCPFVDLEGERKGQIFG